ncbi:MAG: hypothetical protein HY514_00375 [Candidatus Aenigmarchaeota archaeon]|nr:hypothetical protein [Candidatus Aenigmarchaeota archaeon]
MKGITQETGLLLVIGIIIGAVVLFLFLVIHIKFTSEENIKTTTITGLILPFALRKGFMPSNIVLKITMLIGTALVLYALWGVIDAHGQKNFVATLFNIGSIIGGPTVGPGGISNA